MGGLQSVWHWLLAKDPALNFDQRLQRWVNVATAIGIVVSLVSGGIAGWIFSNPWIGVVIGLVFWVVLLNTFVALGRRAQPSTPSEPAASVEDTPQRTVDWRSQWFGIPTSEDARERLTQLMEKNERSASPDPLIKVLAENERLKTERKEARAEIERLKTENERLRAKIQQLDEDLKQRCRKLVAELSEFVDERAQGHPQKKTLWPNLKEATRYNTETMEQYNRRFGREVAILLDVLERRGHWSDPKERKKFENPRMAQNIRNLQALVQRLGVLCERL